MSKKKAVYFDIDGTLARFHDADKMFIEAMWTQGFYVGLKPFENLVAAVKLFVQRNPDVEVFSLSAVLDTEPPFVVGEKNVWLDKYLPEIDRDHRIFTRAGEDKSKYIDMNAFDCSLVDDFNKNLYEFEMAGGRAIKFHNDVNHRGLGEFGGSKGNLWAGDLIHHYDSPEKICSDLEMLVLGKSKAMESGLEDFVIEDHVLVEYIGHAETVVIPEGVREIGINAFWNNKDVKHVVFPESVRDIRNHAFAGVDLAEVHLPGNLRSIGEQAFAGNRLLERVNVPASVTSLHKHAFDCCDRLTEIQVDPENEKYFSVDGIVYKGGWESNVLRCPCGMTGTVDVSRSDYFGKILPGAFKDTHISSVRLSRNLFSIEDGAFYGSDIESIEIPSGTRHIQDFAFGECRNLTRVVMPEHLESMGEYLFGNCQNLREIVISDDALVDYCNRFGFLDEVFMLPCYEELKNRYEVLVKGQAVDSLIQDATERVVGGAASDKGRDFDK